MADLSTQEVNTSPGPQVVPHSREAEEAVIGAILINPEAYYDVAQFLTGDDFYIHRHRWIWDVFTKLQEQRTPIDFLTVTEELDQKGQLGEVVLGVGDLAKDPPDAELLDDLVGLGDEREQRSVAGELEG